MMRMHARRMILSASLGLSGCVAAWGGAYKVESQTPEAITVHYDTNFVDEQEITALAEDHCRNAGKAAVLQTHDKNFWNISSETFRCQAVPVTPR